VPDILLSRRYKKGELTFLEYYYKNELTNEETIISKKGYLYILDSSKLNQVFNK